MPTVAVALLRTSYSCSRSLSIGNEILLPLLVLHLGALMRALKLTVDEFKLISSAIGLDGSRVSPSNRLPLSSGISV